MTAPLRSKGKTFEKPFPMVFWAGSNPLAGPLGTVPEFLFEKKGLIPAVQQLLVSS